MYYIYFLYIVCIFSDLSFTQVNSAQCKVYIVNLGEILGIRSQLVVSCFIEPHCLSCLLKSVFALWSIMTQLYCKRMSILLRWHKCAHYMTNIWIGTKNWLKKYRVRIVQFSKKHNLLIWKLKIPLQVIWFFKYLLASSDKHFEKPN